MSQVKKKLLIPIAGDVFVRNFIDSGAFSNLQADYEVRFLLSSSVKKSLPHGEVHLVRHDDVKRRSLSRYRTGYLTMKRHRRRSRSFDLKYRGTFHDHLSPFKKGIFNVLAAPGVCEAFFWANEKHLGTLPEVDHVVKDVAPDLMLIPSGFSDSFSIDCLKSAKSAGIQTLMLMFNWDNVSCKGLLPVLPDFLGVWGEQTKEQAIRIHGLSDSQVKILGSPQFEPYFHAPELSAERKREVRRQSEVPDGKFLIVYLGISRYRDEIALLRILEEAIRSGQLPDAHILYRPHPWREIAKDEKNFFDCGFKHITMDAQLKEHYAASMTRRNYDVKSFVPDYNYAPLLLGSVDAAISSLTTMGIEAMIMGKPVLLPTYPDEKYPFSVDTLIQYDHHDCWRRFRDAILCDQQKNLVRDCQRLIALGKDPEVGQRTREDVKYVVYSDSIRYEERLRRLIEALLR